MKTLKQYQHSLKFKITRVKVQLFDIIIFFFTDDENVYVQINTNLHNVLIIFTALQFQQISFETRARFLFNLILSKILEIKRL